MKPWSILQHVAFEGPGLIGEEAERRGLELRSHRMDRGETMPAVEEIGGLVVMGGPMGVMDVREHPFLPDEQRIIAAAVERELPVFGVCLGSQLLAAALGANVWEGPELEIGFGEVTLTAEGQEDPILGPAGPTLPVFHWHHDTFALPRGAAHLAASDRYAHQAFRVGRAAYGLQFHVELDGNLAADLAPHLPDHVEMPESDRAALEKVGRGVLARFFDVAMPLAARPCGHAAGNSRSSTPTPLCPGDD